MKWFNKLRSDWDGGTQLKKEIESTREKIARMQEETKVRMAEIEAATAKMRAQMQTRIAAQSNIEARNEERWAESLARQGITEEDVPLNEWPHAGFNPQVQQFKPNACGNPWCPVCGPPAVYMSGTWAQALSWAPPVTMQPGQVVTAANLNAWARGYLPGMAAPGNWTIGNPQQEDDVPPPNEGDQ